MLRKTLNILKKHIQYYNLYYFILIIVLVLGIIIGPMIVNVFEFNMKLLILKFVNPFYKIALLNNSLGSSTMKATMLSNIYLILAIYLSSFFSINIIIIPLLMFIKGLGIGFTVGFIVSNQGLKGFLLSIVGIYPQNVFILSGLIGLGAVAMSTGNSIRTNHRAMLVYGNKNNNDNLLLGIIYVAIILFGAMIEGAISYRFLKFTLDFFV